MKLYKILHKNSVACALLASAMMFSSCSDFLDINETPNNPVAVPTSALLPTVLTSSAFANSNELNRFGSVIMSVTAGAANSPATYDRYILSGSDFGNQWNYELYGGALVNTVKLEEVATAINSPAYVGIAKIMRAYNFAIATDVWGDVPYSEALQGANISQPKLDEQKDIYLGNSSKGITGLMELVKDGLADLDKVSATKPGQDDTVYGGNMDNWKRAGNTLLLKLALQISKVEPAQAKSIIDGVVSGGNYIKDNSQNLGVKFGAQVNSQNPIHVYTNVSSFSTDQLISTRFVNLLKGSNDPRLDKFVTKPTGDFVTIDNGFAGTVPAAATRSKYSSYVVGDGGEAPIRLLTNWQRAFILAEAAVSLGTAGDAQALFEEGIRASMTSAGVTAEQIEEYFTENEEALTLTGTKEQQVEKIITQKYISLFGNGLEQWNDWRRTGYPVLAPHQNAGGIDGTRPVRAMYLESEIARNPNFPKNIYSNVRVWWDVD